MRTRQLALLVVVASMFAATPSFAISVTFGQFVQAGGGQMFTGTYTSFDILGVPFTYNSVSADAQVYFYYLATVPPALQGPQLAHLVLHATSFDQASDNGVVTSQEGYQGMFTITLATPIDGKSNLLSGTFNGIGGKLSGTSGGTSATLQDSTPPVGEVVFTSDFLDFDSQGVQEFSFSFSSVIQNFSRNSQTGYLNPFTAAGSGTFSADLMETPEPAVLVLMGSGLLALGFLRRRKK
jgi:hypothetical protein